MAKKYTETFNRSSDRRQSQMEFSGPERRVLIMDQMRMMDEEQRVEDFLTKLHMIPDISRVSKNVNGSV